MSRPPQILHLSHDNQFLKPLSRAFELAAPGASDYVVLAAEGEMRHSVAGRLTVVATAEQARARVREMIRDFDALVVHYMFPAWAEIIPEISKSVPVLWSGYGGDYYGTEPDGLLGDQTLALVGRRPSREFTLSRILDARKRRRNERALRAAAASSTFFSAPVRADLAVFSSRYPEFVGDYVQLNYASVGPRELGRPGRIGENILIGNSATPTNNHLDVFSSFSTQQLQGQKVFVPLSYGDTGYYRDAVIAAGRKAFGSDFHPLLEMLPPDEYGEIVKSCGYVAMGHLRQQGLGNIIAALQGGSTLLLERRNPVFHELSSLGFGIAALDSLQSQSLEDLKLSGSERESNLMSVYAEWGAERVQARLRDFLERVATIAG